jgi:3-deoxy-D-manno-octulosonic-acid transferase
MHWRRSFIFFLYRCLGWLLFPIFSLYLVRRVLRQRDYAKFLPERFGFLPSEMRQAGHSAIWLHAVSVGEIAAASGLVETMRKRFPLATMFVSVSTVAGRKLAETRLSDKVDGIFYLPADYCFAIRRVLRHIKPVAVVIMETEIWPNLYHEVKKTGAGLITVNGRISERAFPRYLKARWLFREVLALPSVILAQDHVSRDRFAALMDEHSTLSVGGNLKYDQNPREQLVPDPLQQLLQRLNPQHVWIAASTMPPAREGDPDEDEVVVEQFQHLVTRFPHLLLILAPRHPERFQRAAERLQQAGIAFIRRSEINGDSRQLIDLPGVLLLDSIGELASLFGHADVVLMGGTLNHRGGHNILEPAQAGCAIVLGPHMENFPEIAADFRSAGAVAEASTPQAMGEQVARLLGDAGARSQLGRLAGEQARRGRGATERCIACLAQLYEHCIPRLPRSWWHYAFFWPLAQAWRLAAGWNRSRKLRDMKRLPVPVLCIGNVSTGGAGKTPTVIWLSKQLGASHQPGILTRGYGRMSRDPVLIADPGTRLSRELTGDEARILIERTGLPVGIGADRYRTGLELLEKHPVSLLLLDDGLQHWRLARNCNLVVIDTLQPFGEDDLVPLGRLREPLAEAFARADLFLLTRTESGARLKGIERRLRGYNPNAPIFRSRVAPQHWVNARSGEQVALQALSQTTMLAFCGLGNPNSFFLTLRGLGYNVTTRFPFPDHHLYRPFELERLDGLARARGASSLVCTEKDIHNLDQQWLQKPGHLPLYWLHVNTDVDEADALLACINRCLVTEASSKLRPDA